MEARPGVGVAAAVEGEVVAVGVGVGVAAAPPPRQARMNQDELRRQMELLAEDARQRSVGRRIAGITHTNTVTTVYKDGGEPEVYRTSSRLSTPNTVLKKHGDVLGRPNVQMPRQKRRPRRRRSQRGGVSPGLITGIFKTAHKTTKAIGEHQQKNAEKISRKRRAEVASSKRKKYAGESFN